MESAILPQNHQLKCVRGAVKKLHVYSQYRKKRTAWLVSRQIHRRKFVKRYHKSHGYLELKISHSPVRYNVFEKSTLICTLEVRHLPDKALIHLLSLRRSSQISNRLYKHLYSLINHPSSIRALCLLCYYIGVDRNGFYWGNLDMHARVAH